MFVVQVSSIGMTQQVYQCLKNGEKRERRILMIGEGNIVQLIGNFGFPIVVTIYLLHRFENKIDTLENTIHNIANVVNNSIEKRK